MLRLIIVIIVRLTSCSPLFSVRVPQFFKRLTSNLQLIVGIVTDARTSLRHARVATRSRRRCKHLNEAYTLLFNRYNNNISRNRTIKQWVMKSTPCRYWSMGIQCPYGNSCWYEHEEKEMPRMDEHLTFAPMSFLYENGIPLEYSIGKDRSGRRMRTSADKSKNENTKSGSEGNGNRIVHAGEGSLLEELHDITPYDVLQEKKNENTKLGSEGNGNRIVHAGEGSLLEELHDITPYDVLQEKDPRSDLSICCLYASGGECLLGDSCYFVHPKSEQ
uniref:C3H1-type domain-containing protein n=1 Tax=Ascaris lumbricoides TaxID=6252 RepID=A0A0M3IIF1_ASCLU